MLESLPALRKQLQKIQKNQKINQDSKVQRYQKKLLQLLIREKTTIQQNLDLSQQLQDIKKNLIEAQKQIRNSNKTINQKSQQLEFLKSELQKIHETLQNLETQNKMNQIGRMNEEEKYAQLMDQYKQEEEVKKKLLKQLERSEQQNQSLKKRINELISENQQKIFQTEVRIQKLQKQAESTQIKHKQLLAEAYKEIETKSKVISEIQQRFSKLQQILIQSNVTESSLKQKMKELIDSNTHLQSKVSQLSKELHLAKLKIKQYQESLYSTEIQKGEQSIQVSKLIKENKKIKKELTDMEQKIKELEDEKEVFNNKYEQANKNYKNARKELDKFKDSLSEATQFQTGVRSKIQKLQLVITQYRQNLQQKDQQTHQLQEKLAVVESELSSSKNQSIQLKFSFEEMRKKYDILVEARNIAEEKLVLEREENGKSLASMIKDKDLCYRQNYKLMQLLEIKEKTIQKIMNGLKNVDELQRDLSLQLSGKENNTKKIIDEILKKDIRTHKDRVKLIEEHIQSNKL